MDVLIPLGTVGAALTVHPDTAIPHPKSKLKIQLSFDPVVFGIRIVLTHARNPCDDSTGFAGSLAKQVGGAFRAHATHEDVSS